MGHAIHDLRDSHAPIEIEAPVKELHLVQGLIAPQGIGAPEVDALVLIVGKVGDAVGQLGRSGLIGLLRTLQRECFHIGEAKPRVRCGCRAGGRGRARRGRGT